MQTSLLEALRTRLHNVLYASQRYQIGFRSLTCRRRWSGSGVGSSPGSKGPRVFPRKRNCARRSTLKHSGQLFDRNRQDVMITGQTTIGGDPKRCVGCAVARIRDCKLSNSMSGNVAQTGEPKSRMLKNLYSETHRSLGVGNVKQQRLLT
jgi:hypothetical protein